MSTAEYDPTDEDLRLEARSRTRDMSAADAAARVAELKAYPRPSRVQRAELDVLTDRAAQRARLEVIAGNPAATESTAQQTQQRYLPAGGDASERVMSMPFGPDATSRARRLLDRCHEQGLPDAGADLVEQLLTTGRVEDRERAAQWTWAVANPVYERAFWSLLRDPQSAHLFWDDAERNAVAHARAMAVGTGSAGGFAVPLALDPTVILTSDGSMNPVRQLARTVRITVNVWDGVTSAGVVSNWYAEGAEVTDDSPALGQPSIPTHRQSTFVPFSVELDGDWATVQTEMRRLMLDAADQLDAEAFTTGTGVGQPKGVVTALTGSGSEVTTAAGAYGLADLEKAQRSVPPRFRPRRQWAISTEAAQAARHFEIVTGVSAVTGGRLLDDPYAEASHLGDATTGSHVAVVGDWQSGYVIVERVGASIELVPHLFGSNQRPTGQRGLFLWRRVGADVVNANALRMLTIG